MEYPGHRRAGTEPGPGAAGTSDGEGGRTLPSWLSNGGFHFCWGLARVQSRKHGQHSLFGSTFKSLLPTSLK